MEKKADKKKQTILASVIVVALIAIIAVFFLKGEEGYRSIQVYQVNGTAKIARENVGDMDAYENLNLISGDKVDVKQESFLRLKLDEDKYLFAEADTAMRVYALGDEKNSKTNIELERGSITIEVENKLNEGSSFEVTTPNSVMAVRGTVFRITADIDEDGNPITTVTVLEGSVAVQEVNADGTVSEETLVPDGKEAVIYEENGEEVIVILDEIDITELPLEVLEFLEEISEERRELSVPIEEIRTVIEEKKQEIQQGEQDSQADDQQNQQEDSEQDSQDDDQQNQQDDDRQDEQDDNRQNQQGNNQQNQQDNNQQNQQGNNQQNQQGNNQGSQDEQQPSEDEQNPSQDEQQPSEDEQNPSEDEDNPPQDEQNPSEDEDNPPQDEQNPSEDEEQPPQDEEQSPSEDEDNPPQDEQNPSEDEEQPPQDEEQPSEDEQQPPQEDTQTYTVTFTYNGVVFGTQTVESGKTAAQPTLMPAPSGKWDFDFSTPITKDTEIAFVEES